MSELDKEAVLDEFTAAYKEAHGKKPKIEDSNGWYSVDGGKNMRLAQLDEWAKELRSDKSKTKKSTATKSSTKKSDSSAKKASSSKTATKKTTTKKAPAKKQASKSTKKPAKKASSAKSSGKGKADSASGQSPAQAWQAYLEQQAGDSRLPRGFKAS